MPVFSFYISGGLAPQTPHTCTPATLTAIQPSAGYRPFGSGKWKGIAQLRQAGCYWLASQAKTRVSRVRMLDLLRLPPSLPFGISIPTAQKRSGSCRAQIFCYGLKITRKMTTNPGKMTPELVKSMQVLLRNTAFKLAHSAQIRVDFVEHRRGMDPRWSANTCK